MTEQKFDRILFKPEMVRAILAGQKRQTRRVLKPQPPPGTSKVIPEDPGGKGWLCVSQFGGGEFPPSADPWRKMRYARDLLGVCETWVAGPEYDTHRPSEIPEDAPIAYRAGGWLNVIHPSSVWGRWRPSIFMCTWMIRLFLRVERRWCERLQDISEEDAVAEGVGHGFTGGGGWPDYQHINDHGICELTQDTAAMSFATLWDSINAEPKPVKRNGEIVRYESYPWEDVRETREHRGKPWLVYGNPWVECYAFEVDEELSRLP